MESTQSVSSTQAETGARACTYALGFLVLNLLLKLSLITMNEAEYTDGILQLLVFSKDAGLYPPLYGLLASAVSAVTHLDLQMSGRLVSILASSLAVLPIYYMARWIGNDAAARFTCIFYTIAPLVTRWGIRVMTDALFLFLVATFMCLVLVQFVRADRARGEGCVPVPRTARGSDWTLALASLVAALATLTRYQGILLVPLLALAAIVHLKSFRSLPKRTAVVSLVWAAVPAWILTHRFVHTAQFADRTTAEVVSTLLAYLNVLESFVLISPYFFTFPVFVFFLVGLAHLNLGRSSVRAFLWLWGALAFATLILQSVFGSFQYRYLMPLFPAVVILAGLGCAWFEARMIARRRYYVFSLLFYLCVICTAMFTCAVLVFQRQSLGEQRQAAEYINRHISPETPLFSNELYGTFKDLQGVKLSFWTGGRNFGSVYDYLPRRFDRPPPKLLPKGSIVVLGNVYGGDEQLDRIMSQLTFFYHVRQLANYDSTVYPIMDDVMVNPMLNQNPLAWVMRYTPQHFSSHVLIADAPRNNDELKTLIGRQMAPPGMRPVRGPDGKLGVFADDLTTTAKFDDDEF